MKTAIVIGAGITGLAAAATLKKHGHQVRLLEKSGRAGGAIETLQEKGYTVETGPHSLMLSSL
ncbi:MAG: FAD-dependent oxidoreductase, partial [Verrucomicrobiota bacterium]